MSDSKKRFEQWCADKYPCGIHRELPAIVAEAAYQAAEAQAVRRCVEIAEECYAYGDHGLVVHDIRAAFPHVKE